jgi:general secretion pathway protein M
MFNLLERERNILIAGIVFLVLFFGFQLGIVPMFEKRENFDRILKERQKALEEMIVLQQQYSVASNQFDTNAYSLSQRKKNFSLFSFVDSLAQQSGIKENVAYMKPLSKKFEKTKYMLAIVKVKLNDVYLKEFMEFLYRIESSGKGVNITSLSLSKSSKSGSNKDRDKLTLDAIIETQTLKFNGKV